MPLLLIKTTIAAGQSLSGAANLGSNRLLRIRTPAAWRSANLTFLIASADVADQYWPLCHRQGGPVVLASVQPRTVIGLPADITHFLQEAWIKIHSGHGGQDVIQPQACEFEFVLLKGVAATLLPAEMEE